MAQVQQATPPEAKWRPILNRYHYGQKTIKLIFQDMLKTFEEVEKSDKQITIGQIISVKEIEEIQKRLGVKPTIAFFGQVNAGKSSLANELLGEGTWLPVAPDPCTSRMVRLKYYTSLYKEQIPFEGKPEPRQSFKNRIRPTVKDIQLSDEEKKDPRVFEVELLFGVPNPVLYPGLEFVDLPGWGEKSALNEAINVAVTRITHPALLPVYVLDGNLTVTKEDRKLIEILTNKMGNRRLMFVCNKIDHEEENLRRDHGDGELQVSGDGSAVYVHGDCKKVLLNKAQATFDGLMTYGFVSDTGTDRNASSFHPVSVKMLKASRLGKDVYQAEYYKEQFDNFTKHLNLKLEKILVHHVLSTIRKANAVVARFAEGTISTRSASSNVSMLEILQKAEEAEKKGYTDCLEFLSQERKSIEVAVHDACKATNPRILRNAKIITAEDFNFENEDETVPAVAFIDTIANMTMRILNQEITKRIEEVKEKYVKSFELLFQVAMGSFNVMICDIWRCMFQSDHPNLFSIAESTKESGKAYEAGLDLFCLIPEAVNMSLRQTFNDVTTGVPKLFKALTKTLVGLVDLDEKWKESIAQEILSILDVTQLATRIVDNCKRKLDEKHRNYVQSHEQIIELHKAKLRSQDDILYFRTEFTPKISLLLLRLYAMQCCFETGEPERGEMIGEGRHSSTFAYSSCNGVDKHDSLVIKVFNAPLQKACEHVAQPFYALRTLQGNDQIYKCVVKVEGVFISPLDTKDETQRLVQLMEKRAMTLPEALRSGLSSYEKKLIALDVCQCLSFLHSESIVLRNLVINDFSLDKEKRAKLDMLKLRESLFDDSWLKCPAFHQAPEVFRNESAIDVSSNVYSFGILLWEIFNESLQPPACYAECHTKDEMQKKVCDDGLRPEKAASVEDEWYAIMQDCWKMPEDRPSVKQLMSRIQDLAKQVVGYSTDLD